MKLAILTGVTALLLIVFIFELLRRRQLREKYAVLWLTVGLLALPFGFAPGSVNDLAQEVGVANGASLVLFLAVVFLLLVCIHLSWEASQLEDETRTLAEEIALIRTELRDLKTEVGAVTRDQVANEAEALTAAAAATSAGPVTTVGSGTSAVSAGAAALPNQREGKGELVDD